MSITIADLIKGDTGIIKSFPVEEIPMKLIEMGCIPGNEVRIIQKSFADGPLYIQINESFLAIRRHVAAKITLEL